MTIKIITGTITGFDTFGDMLKLKRSGFFYQWYWTRRGWGKVKTKIISELERSEIFKIVQTTGSGKTLLAAIWLYQDHQRGFKTAANMNFAFSDTVLDSYEDFLKLTNTKILLDDIRHVIAAWNSKDAKISSEFANSSRKKKDEIYITTQRLENFVPPDIRMITDEIHVPYIRCFDATQKSPDGRYLPLEICDLRFSAGMEYLGHKVYNLTGKTGKIILNSFDTLQISTGLT
jgi:hypothetical protein